MERADFLTKRLRLVATNTPTPVYDYFLRSISSANDQPADLEWMSHFELLHGYFLIGHYNFHIWPIWTGVGGNGKSENARLIKSTLGDFCAVVRWSELTHDERGGDNTTKRLNFKLLQSRVALVEEMGQTSGINRVLETSTVKQLTGGGEIIGADLYRSEVHGDIKFKLVSLMNEAPHIEPDRHSSGACKCFRFVLGLMRWLIRVALNWPWSARTRLPACVSLRTVYPRCCGKSGRGFSTGGFRLHRDSLATAKSLAICLLRSVRPRLPCSTRLTFTAACLSCSSLVLNRLMSPKESCWHSGNRSFGRTDVTPGRLTWVN